MKSYLIRRLLQSVLVLLGVSVVVFLILHLTGDPALLLLPPDATAEDLAKFREAMGFNDPVAVQYIRFLRGAIRGNFGDSLRHGEPAMHLVLERLPATFELAGAGLLIAVGLAIPAGIVSAVRRNTLIDYISTVVALLGQAMPTFWLGIMLISCSRCASAGCRRRGGATSSTSSCPRSPSACSPPRASRG